MDDGDDDWVRKRTRKVAGPLSVCGDWRAIHPATSPSMIGGVAPAVMPPEPGDGGGLVVRRVSSDPSAGEETRGVQRIRTRVGRPAQPWAATRLPLSCRSVSTTDRPLGSPQESTRTRSNTSHGPFSGLPAAGCGSVLGKWIGTGTRWQTRRGGGTAR